MTFIAVVLCGCASANTAEQVGRPPTMKVSQEAGAVIGEAPIASTIAIAAAPTMVWVAVKKTYSAFEIPVTVENPALHQLGNPDFNKTRTLAGQPMATLVDCGIGNAGPNAARYRIYISLLTNVSADGAGGTKVQLGFVANGRDVAGNSTETVSCATNGRFEKIFLDRVKLIVANGG